MKDKYRLRLRGTLTAHHVQVCTIQLMFEKLTLNFVVPVGNRMWLGREMLIA